MNLGFFRRTSAVALLSLMALPLLTMANTPGCEQPAFQQWCNEVSDSQFSGSVLAAHQGDVIFSGHFGLANRELKQPFAQDTVFDIGSITKQFTASAILKLSETQQLSLQATLSDFFDHVPGDKQKITVHHLLSHSSGLTQGFGLYDVVERDKFIEQAFASELLSVPGEKYHYSNLGYSLLAAIIEKVTGTGWEEYIRENLLLPAGLKNTGYRTVERTASKLAVNYGREPNALQRLFSITAASRSVGHSLQHQYQEPGPRWYMEGAGSFLSTMTDMYHWYLVLRAEKILSKPSWSLLFTPHIAENDTASSHYGYGWVIDKNKRGEPRIHHNGSNSYSFADFKYYPDSDVFIFLATNNKDDMPVELISRFEDKLQQALQK